jgi:hypothetical protein
MKSITSYTQKEKNNMYSIETKKLSKNFKDKIVVNEINLQIKKIVFKKKMINVIYNTDYNLYSIIKINNP